MRGPVEGALFHAGTPSRQEHWSGLHFLLQCMKVKSESEFAQSCPTLSNPQATVLEWGATPPLLT